MDKTDEYTLDEGVYSSLSSSSGQEGDFKVLQQSTDSAKQELLQIHKRNTKSHVCECHKEVSRLKQDVNALEISKQCKESSIVQLKLKIREQQELIQQKLQENHKWQLQLNAQQNELIAIDKLVEWYRNQLHEEQSLKNSMQNEVARLKSTISHKDNKITQLKNALAERQQCKSKNECFDLIPVFKTTKLTSDAYYLEEISTNNKEIAALRCMIQEQNDLLAESRKEKKEVALKCAILEQKCRDVDSRILQFETNAQTAKETINGHEFALREKEEQIMYMKSEMSKLRVVLDAAMKEKKTIQDTVNVVQSGFQKFLSMHEELKDELREKNKLTTSLEQTIQDNFMQENWRKCAIEEQKAKDFNNLQVIQRLEQLCANLRQNLEMSKSEKANLVLELKEVKKLYKNLLEKHCETVPSDFHSGNELIVALQDQVAKLTDSLHLKCSQMRYKQERYELHNRTFLRKVKMYMHEKRVLERRNHRLFERNHEMYLKLHQNQLYAENLEQFVYKRNVRIKNLIDEKNRKIIIQKAVVSSGSQTNIGGIHLSRLFRDYAHQQMLINDFIIEKSFLQRLIYDLKAALTTVSSPNIATTSLGFTQVIPPASIPNMEEIELLLEKHSGASRHSSLERSLAMLKNEMSDFKAEFCRNF